MSKYDMSDYQWKQIMGLIPGKTSKSGQPRRDARELINGINWVNRTGAPWCALPEEYGPWHTAYNNFRKWTKDGTIEKIFVQFSAKPEEEAQIDGTYVRAHQHAAGLKKNLRLRAKRLREIAKPTVKSAEAEEA